MISMTAKGGDWFFAEGACRRYATERGPSTAQDVRHRLQILLPDVVQAGAVCFSWGKRRGDG